MKRLLAAAAIGFLVASGLLLTGSPTPAHADAGDPLDIAFTTPFNPQDRIIRAGDNFTLAYTIANTGTQPIAPATRTRFFYPPEVSFVSISNGLQCPDLVVLPTVWKPSFNSRFSNENQLTCYGNDEGSLFSTLQVGQQLTFNVTFRADSPFTEGRTRITAINHPVRSHVEWDAETIDALWDIYQVLEMRVPFAGGNNTNYYVYNAPATTTTIPGVPTTTIARSQNNNSSNQSNNTTTVGGRTTAGVPSPAAGSTTSSILGALDGSPLTNSDGQASDSTEQAEIALDLRSSIPDRVSREDTGTWDALLAGSYRNQIMAATILFTIAAAGFFLLRKRYLRKTSNEKSYQKALKISHIPREASDSQKVS